MDFIKDFIAGGTFGLTSVIVGQPLDTIRTRSQARNARPLVVAKELAKREGLRGFYRGSLPMLFGGTMFRSAQFGVHGNVLKVLEGQFGKRKRLNGWFDWQNSVAGLFGGMGRALIEAPFDFVKVRRQVDVKWSIHEIFNGSRLTIVRNSILFGCFVTYIDVSKVVFPNDELGSFWTGAICANLAWITVWPLDVAKSMAQSGLFEAKSSGQLFGSVLSSGSFFRGLGPGLARSTIANGCSMVVYTEVKKILEEK